MSDTNTPPILGPSLLDRTHQIRLGATWMFRSDFSLGLFLTSTPISEFDRRFLTQRSWRDFRCQILTVTEPWGIRFRGPIRVFERGVQCFGSLPRSFQQLSQPKRPNTATPVGQVLIGPTVL